nr:bifunctional [glutamate--ammonia ligase]-adenylyl-L-tyrosine phosphorylase/[glutamate--ammonia-ligase] adenylyltransferase [Desulfurispira natronophila]
MCINNLERLIRCSRQHFAEPWSQDSLHNLTALLSSSVFIPRLMQRSSHLLEVCHVAPQPYPRAYRYEQPDFIDLEKQMQDLDERAFMRLVRTYRNRKMVEIALRDLLAMDSLEVVLGDLSMLAEITLELCLRYAWNRLVQRYGPPMYEDYDCGEFRQARFGIIGLGKLGGGDLNYCSDIDIMYIYNSAYNGTTKGGSRQPIETHLFFVELCKLITRYMSENTEDGFVFRVDLRLRPDGDAGAICLALQGYENYYTTMGQTWERSMLIKARPVGGDDQMVRQFQDMVRPFIFRKYMDENTILSIRELKQKIDTKIRKNLHSNVKLGRGGIREIEFFIAIIQLLYGGKDRQLQQFSTARALDVLQDQKYIERSDAEELWQCYLFLRNVEHRIQMHDQRQSHTVPDDEACQLRLARQMGYDSIAAFQGALQEIMQTVNGHFTTLFVEDTHEKPVPEEIFSGNYSREELLPMLSQYRFANPRKAAVNIYAIIDQAMRSEEEHRRLRAIAPVLLQSIDESPDPDLALNNFERFLLAIARKVRLLKLFYETPEVIQIFITVFANSNYLSNIINLYPETTDILISPPWTEEELPTVQFYFEQLQQKSEPLREDTEAYLDVLRSFKSMEFLHIGYRELRGKLDVSSSTAVLSNLADAIVLTTYEYVFAELKERYGTPIFQGEACGFVIVGLGKFGGRELNYSSDLDLIFLYDGAGETSGGSGGSLRNNEFFIRLVQRLINRLSVATSQGVCYKVDARLRPNGDSGTLVTPVDGFVEYHENNKAMTWEKQMLLRARYICGDQKLYRTFRNYVNESIFGEPFTPQQYREIYDMRMRIEHQKGRAKVREHDYKTGPGGLVDIEFLSQVMQIEHSSGHRELLEVARTFELIDALQRAGAWQGDDGTTLREAYLFYRHLENMVKIYQDNASSRLQLDETALTPLAFRMGYRGKQPGSELLRRYKQTTAVVRELFEQYFSRLTP